MRRIISIFFMLFAIVTIGLGVWQIQRGFLKKELHEQYLARQSLPLVELNSALLYQDEYDNRRVQVVAQHIPNYRVFVENVSQDGTPGYYVVEFAELSDHTRFAVIRGFVPIGQDRRFVPQLPELSSNLEVEGLIRGYSDRVISIGSTASETMGNGIYRVQYLEQAALESIIGSPLPEKVVLVVKPEESQLRYNWPVPSASSAHRSFSYAIQWFLMSFAAISFLLVMRYRSRTE